MSELWVDLFEKNKARYAGANPKRGKFIYSYFYKQDLIENINKCTFLELGAFSAKDSLYLKSVLSDANFYLSDLEPDILKSTPVITGFAADVFKLPLRDSSVDVSFHSGLIVLFENSLVEKIIDSQNRITRKYAFVFGLNKLNILDHCIAFYRYKIRGNPLYNYRRFTKGELYRMMEKNCTITTQIFYHDNMMENFARRHNSKILNKIAKTFFFRLPFFYNEVVMVMKKKCAG